MSSNGKSIRGSLAGRELIGFKKSSEQDDRALERASSAKVGPTKAPKKPVGGTKKSAPGDRT